MSAAASSSGPARQPGCVEQKTAKYTSATRVSPAYPANICKGQVMLGRDGSWWTSVPDKNLVYRWKRGLANAPASSASSAPSVAAPAAMPVVEKSEPPKRGRKKESVSFVANPFQSGAPLYGTPSASPLGSPVASPKVSRATSPVLAAKKEASKSVPARFTAAGAYIDPVLFGEAGPPKAVKGMKPGKDESSWELDSLIKVRKYDGQVWNPNSKSWVSPNGTLGQALLQRMRFVEQFKALYGADYNL